jgi:vancomycin resistance protein YoaR
MRVMHDLVATATGGTVRRATAVAGVLALAASATLVIAERFGGEYVPSGVRVGAVVVGGLSPEEAARRLELQARARARHPIVVEGPGRRIATTGVSLEAKARVAEALEGERAGRVGLVRHWLGLGRSRNLSLRYDLPPGTVQALARRLGAAPGVDASIEVSAEGIVVGRGRAGRIVDVAALQSQLSTLPSRVTVPTINVPPRISTRAASMAAARARRLTESPRTLLVGADARTLTPRDLRSLLVVRRTTAGFTIEFDQHRLARLLPPASAPRDATLTIEGQRVRVVPAVLGRTVDVRATARALAHSARTPVRAPVVVQQPEVTTAELRALGIRERISAFTTHYPPGQPRVVNIQRASAVIDGTILRPGETFSMNAVLGERTAAKGYVPAPQIVGSSFADSVGGGISQVATMLYNGAFFAGLELIEHQPHTLYIDRYPLGREATISWGGPELIFRNDWPASVLIKLETSPSSIVVSFFSSRLGRRVETETGVPYGHGGGNFLVEYTRRVYRGNRLARNERFRVRYGVAAAARIASGR